MPEDLMKIYAYLAASLLVAGVVWWQVSLHKKAARAETAEKALADYGAEVEARDKETTAKLDRATKRGDALAGTVSVLTRELDKIRSTPIKNSVTYVKVPGEPCPRPRISGEWIGLHNEAADAASRAVRPAD